MTAGCTRSFLKVMSMLLSHFPLYYMWSVLIAFSTRRPLIAPDIAQAAVYMIQQPLNISVKAMDVVPSGM